MAKYVNQKSALQVDTSVVNSIQQSRDWHFAWTDKQSAELNGICLKIKTMILQSVLDPLLEYLLFINNMFLGFKGDQLF